MKLKTTLFAAAATIAISPAAHAYEGLYGAIGAGLSYVQPDRDFEELAAGIDGEVDYDNGVGVYAAIGYDYGNSWRGELEFSFADNDLRHIAGGPGFQGFGAESNLSGSLTQRRFMANLIRDIDGLPGWTAVTPYIGGGVGVAFTSFEATGTNATDSIAFDGSTPRFAYQGIAGLAVDLAENLILDLSYRYTSTLKRGASNDLTDPVFSNIRTGTDTHSLFAGLRWQFGAAPVAPTPQYKDCWDGSSVPLSADCPPQIDDPVDVAVDPLSLIVYFDYDKSNLTPEAANLVREASSRALENDIDTVVVSGNTDTSGSSAYNQALSERRARVVREALVANGVPADRIETRAFGESNLAKSTPDGTREPLNRRSEVTISFE